MLRIPVKLLLLVLGALIFSAPAVFAVAAPPDPAVFFTDNWPATDMRPVTVLEQALLDRLNAAQQTIDVALYDFNRASLRDALLAAHERGVAVRLVADDEARANPSYVPYFAALETAGIPIVDDRDESRIMHDKYAVIDGRLVWTGSTNWSNNDLTLNHNNAIALLSPELAQIYRYDFEQMFAGDFGSAKVPSPQTELVHLGYPLEVYFSPQDDALDAVIEEVNAAQVSIDFAAFSFTDDALRNALYQAQRRGVSVRGMYDELSAGNTYSDDELLCAAGVPIIVESTPGKLHNKLLIIDAGGSDPRLITGSLNWSANGADRNSENIVVVRNPDTVQTYATQFAEAWQQPGPGARYLCTGALIRNKLEDQIETFVATDPEAALVRAMGSSFWSTTTALLAQARAQGADLSAAELSDAAGAPCPCTGNLLNCSDFSTQAQAQRCFSSCANAGAGDPHSLDSDKDSVVCESLPDGWVVIGQPD